MTGSLDAEGNTITHAVIRIINLYAYGYNKVHMKTFEQRQHDGGEGDAYGYDEFYRLASVKFNAPDPTVADPGEFEKSKTYAFDKVDNILSIIKTQNEQTDTMQTQVNNLNQYTQFDAESLAYDANGNLKDKGGDSFTYDYRNQLVSANVDAQSVSFKYDALGRRIEKSAGGSVVCFYYDGNQVIEERDGTDTLLAQYMYGNGIDEIVRMDSYESGSPVPYYYHANGIGSVTAITDSAGNLIERIIYDDYGNPTFIDHQTDPQNPTQAPASLISNPYLFQGRRFDPETSLYYYRARYFDPHLARFLQTDPKGYTDSLNLYQAFGQSPVNFVDPFGLAYINIHFGFGPSDRMYEWLYDPTLNSYYLHYYDFPDFSNLDVLAQARGHNLNMRPFTRSDFLRSLDSLDTWTFYIGHSQYRPAFLFLPSTEFVRINVPTGLRFSRTSTYEYPSYKISMNEIVGLFACGSSHYASKLISSPIMFSVFDAKNDFSSAHYLAWTGYEVIKTLLLFGSEPWACSLAAVAGSMLFAKSRHPRDQGDKIECKINYGLINLKFRHRYY